MKKNLAYSDLVERVIKEGKTCIFVSPHLDDALLSCGALIHYLAPQTPVVIVTAFTESHDRPKNLSTWNFLRLSGYKSAADLFAQRRQEDIDIATGLGAKAIHLGFTDSLYRLKPNSHFIYPFFSWALKRGKISVSDYPLIEQIAVKVKSLCTKNTVIFGPAAIGNHMDHLLVRKVCDEYFPQTIYWSDFPYNVWSNKFTFDKPNYSTLEWQKNLSIKIDLLKKLETQINFIFPKGQIPIVSERYYYL